MLCKILMFFYIYIMPFYVLFCAEKKVQSKEILFFKLPSGSLYL